MNGRNRRRKDVPFNPFAQNAAAERNRRHAEKVKEKRRQDNQNQINSADASVTNSSKKKSLEDLQREARKKMGSDIKPSENNIDLQPIKSPVDEKPIEEQVITPKITQTTATKSSVEKKPSREERLAELKTNVPLKVNNLGKIKTGFQMSALFGLLHSNIVFGIINLHVIGILLLFIAAVLTVISFIYYVRNAWDDILS